MRKSSLSEDSFLRMLVAGITELLARLNGLRSAGQIQQARAEIDQRLEELLGTKADLVRRLDDERLREMLTLGDVLDTARAYAVAELFYGDGLLLQGEGKILPAIRQFERAFQFHLEVAFETGEKFPEPLARIEQLAAEWGGRFGEESLFTWFGFLEMQGRYAEAERVLVQMRSVSEFPADVGVELRAFYARLLELEDAELEAGDLPRPAILARLQALSTAK